MGFLVGKSDSLNLGGLSVIFWKRANFHVSKTVATFSPIENPKNRSPKSLKKSFITPKRQMKDSKRRSMSESFGVFYLSFWGVKGFFKGFWGAIFGV